VKTLKRFVALNRKTHDRSCFNCGVKTLNTFLAKPAAKHMQLNISSTYVLPAAGIPKNKPKPIAAFYTLSVGDIRRETLPQANKFPHHPVPVIVLARLAVDIRAQGCGLGNITLIRAIRHCARISINIPAYAIIIDAKDEQTLDFYRRYSDFQPLINNPLRLFMPMNIAKQI